MSELLSDCCWVLRLLALIPFLPGARLFGVECAKIGPPADTPLIATPTFLPARTRCHNFVEEGAPWGSSGRGVWSASGANLMRGRRVVISCEDIYE